MSLVNTETGELIAECTPDEARDLTNRIHTALGVTTELYVEAYTRRAWAALGHASWDAYCASEFGRYQLRLPSEERDEAVQSMRAAGLSIRAIAATGVASKNTVERTLAASGVPKEDTSITGTDGKTYPGSESAAVRAARERREREAAEPQPEDFGTCTAGFDCAAKATAADQMCDWHRKKASETQGSGKAGADSTTDAAAPGSTDADTVASGAEGGGVAEPATAAPPTLPDDWRDRLANATYLLGCPAELLGPRLSSDDEYDLASLATHVDRVLEACRLHKEQNA